MSKVDRLQAVAGKVVTNHQRHNMVAIIVKGGNILSIGNNNQNCTHPAYFKGDYSLGIHAEYDAIRQVRHQDLSNASIYVFYFRRDGTLGDSKPCEDCQEYIRSAGISKVYYIAEGKCEKL